MLGLPLEHFPVFLHDALCGYKRRKNVINEKEN
jgi:hypothetical protein